MLLKQGQENKKEFLEIQNTRSEIKFNSSQKIKFRNSPWRKCKRTCARARTHRKHKKIKRFSPGVQHLNDTSSRKKRENRRKLSQKRFKQTAQNWTQDYLLRNEVLQDKGEDPKNFKRANTGHTQSTKNQNGNRLFNSKSGSLTIVEQCFQDSGRKVFNLEFHAQSNH